MTSESPARPLPRLRLYVAGNSAAAQRALESRTKIIELLGGKIDIEVIDIFERPAEVESAGILATPTLSDESVQPPRRLIGDLTDLSGVADFFSLNKHVTKD